jgi:hypothetical protein
MIHKTEMNDFHWSVIRITDGLHITGEHPTLNCLLPVLQKEVIFQAGGWVLWKAKV